MAVTSIRIRSDLEEPLEVLSKELGRSRNYIINQSIKEYVAQRELAEKRWQETLLALDSIKAGRVVPANKVFQWMRSWGTDNELPRPK